MFDMCCCTKTIALHCGHVIYSVFKGVVTCVCEGMGAGAEMGVYELTVVVKGYGC
jgi:hypothetical protein